METANNLSTTESAQVAEAKTEGAAETEVNLGKFKDVSSLLNAYNSLESEFTRRSQRLTGLEGIAVKNAQSDSIALQNADDASNLKASEGNDTKVNNSENKKEILKGNIENEVKSFLSKYPDASKYSKEISEIAVKNKDYENGFLLKAYSELLENRLKTKEKLFTDENYLKDTVMNNIQLKDAVIKEYLNRIKSGEKITLLSDRGRGVTSPPDRPKTIEQAGLLARDILIKK